MISAGKVEEFIDIMKSDDLNEEYDLNIQVPGKHQHLIECSLVIAKKENVYDLMFFMIICSM